MLNILVNNLSVHKGSEWAMYMGSVVKGPLRALVNGWIAHKGVMHDPS